MDMLIMGMRASSVMMTIRRGLERPNEYDKLSRSSIKTRRRSQHAYHPKAGIKPCTSHHF